MDKTAVLISYIIASLIKMKRETVIEIWDCADFVLIPLSLILKHAGVLTGQMFYIAFIAMLVVLGLTGVVLKFKFNLKWLGFTFIMSVINLLSALLFVAVYIVE